MSQRFGRFCCAIALLFGGSYALALPPLGLTQITPTPTSAGLEIIGDSAYLNVANGVWSVDLVGNKTFVPISHPTLGSPTSVTRVVKGLDGDVYVAANFGNFSNPGGSALFRLGDPSTSVITWEGNHRVQGVDRELRAYGNLIVPMFYFAGATRFFINGAMEPLGYPPGSDSSNNQTYLVSATPSGFALGDAGVPGTIGSAPGIWNPAGEFSFVAANGVANSIRDRIHQNGVNLGWNDSWPVVKYADETPFYVRDQFGQIPNADFTAGVKVSQGNFVAINLEFGVIGFGYYPGIVPGYSDRSLPLLEIFPELTAININWVSDLASVDGYLYMTLSGDDGLYLFGARDPSVIPEPAALALALLAFSGLVAFVRRSPTYSLRKCPTLD